MIEKIREFAGIIALYYRKWKPGVSKFWKGYGYYVSLACLLVLFGSAAYIYRENSGNEAAYMLPEPTVNVPAMAMTYVTPEPTPQPTPYSPSFMKPVEGEIITEYTDDELTWNETLGQWLLHKGIDIAAPAGTVVVAAESGTVSAVYNDDLLGNVIEITHEDGWLTRYCGVETLQKVETGRHIERGDIISAVGNSALIENSLGAHVHFEAMHNGVQMNISFE